MLGQVYLKRYKVVRPLDEGGMSKVYLGMQTEPPREVAIKVLRAELASQPRVRAQFRREAYILAKFHHPNSVTFYDADVEAKEPVLVMEYLRGVDLLHLLQRHKRLSPERTGRLLGQICAVLQAAHDEGIVHRDLKPGNIFVVHPDTPQEKIKLMDYGLAKMSSMLYFAAEEMQTQNHPAAAGTPEYISPEQLMGHDVDRRGDLYSLGVILYEMLTGRRPFEGDVDKLLLAHRDDAPPSFAAAGAADLVPSALEYLVMDCLAKYPEERPQTAEQLAHLYEQGLGRKIYEHERPTSSPSRPTAIVRKFDSAADRNAIVQQVTATMPESMAMLKLKGFICDLGGEIIESLPGLIRVRLGQAKQSSGLFSWFGGGGQRHNSSAINMELQMEQPDPSQPSLLAITLKLTSPSGAFSADGRTKCERIGRDFQAYLMGRAC